MTEGKNKGIDTGDTGRFAPTGANYLLVIAVNEYEYHPQLSNCVRDAEELVNVLQKKYGFEPDRTTTLHDKDATLENIYNSLDKLTEHVTPNDNLLVYFSGHGYLHRPNKTGHFIPVDGRRWHQYLSHSNLLDLIRGINSFHTFLIIDSCFSGSLFISKEVRTTSLAKKVECLPSRWGLAAGQIETVEDGLHENHSPFAKALLGFLSANTHPLMPVSELIQHVKRVTSHNARQTPVGGVLFKTGDVGGEFVFHLRKSETQAWEETKNVATVAAYQKFLAIYPKGRYATEARRLMVEQEDTEAWQNALKKNTIVSYDAYLERYPNGKHQHKAWELLKSLEETKAWQLAQRRDTVSAYRKYLLDYPKSKHWEEAQTRIQDILSQEAWQSTQRANTIAAFKVYLKEFPQSTKAELARSRLQELEREAQAQQVQEDLQKREEIEATKTKVLHKNKKGVSGAFVTKKRGYFLPIILLLLFFLLPLTRHWFANKVRCLVVNTKSGQERIEACQQYLTKESFSKSSCFGVCVEDVDYKNAKQSRTYESLRIYIDKYKANASSPRYKEIFALLDSVACENINQNQSRIKRAISCHAYKTEFGSEGSCYQKCYTFLDAYDCEAAQNASDRKTAYLDYINNYGSRGKCYDDFQKAIEAGLPKVQKTMQNLKPEPENNVPAIVSDNTSKVPSSSRTCQTFSVDNQEFKAIKWGPLWWTAENMNKEGFVTWHQARKLCPTGWRLPCTQEVEHLIRELFSNPARAYVYITSADPRNCEFNLEFTGFQWALDMAPTDRGQAAGFWCWNENVPYGPQAGSYLFRKSEKAIETLLTTDKSMGLNCRCVKESKDYKKSSLRFMPCVGMP